MFLIDYSVNILVIYYSFSFAMNLFWLTESDQVMIQYIKDYEINRLNRIITVFFPEISSPETKSHSLY